MLAVLSVLGPLISSTYPIGCSTCSGIMPVSGFETSTYELFNPTLPRYLLHSFNIHNWDGGCSPVVERLLMVQWIG